MTSALLQLGIVINGCSCAFQVVKERNINVNLHHNLIEINSEKREAIFQILNEDNKTVSMPVSRMRYL